MDAYRKLESVMPQCRPATRVRLGARGVAGAARETRTSSAGERTQSPAPASVTVRPRQPPATFRWTEADPELRLGYPLGQIDRPD